MAVDNRNNVGLHLRNIQIPIITAFPYCILLSEGVRNYELKMIHFTMLPSYPGLPNDDPLSSICEFYSVVQTFPLHRITKDDV